MIELTDITQHYSVRPVLKRISLQIKRGELVVVVGPNGMGKSTLLGVMAGTLTPQKGTVTIAGRRRRGSEEDELAIRKMAIYLSDQPWFPALRTAREFILSVGRLYELADDRLFGHLDALLELFELAPHQDQPIRSLSSGQKKKVALCATLITDVPILLLDEPFSGGLDPAGIVALKRVLQHRVEEQGGTIVLTSPVPEIVEELAHRIVILRDGEVAAFDTLAGLRESAGVHGSLGDILERMLYPDTMRKLQTYFEENTQ
ncbi:MAG TPA: ABC transporter ATP-binding protein [Planctomycetaceae bacterium]|nr:ABC transporter ATP-binding protein [Planctomycetaceae bacterium]